LSTYTLVIGNKNYSSWSLRPWLAMKMAGASFQEVIIPLRQPTTAADIARHSPAGKVPVLHDGEITVWESLAILEYLAGGMPKARLWPDDREARAVARVVSAEMLAGFVALRTHMPMNVRASKPGRGRTPEVEMDIRRIVTLWEDCRARFGEGGPFLFGRFSNADAMYAPVVTRFNTYDVELHGEARAYAETILALPAMLEWFAAGKAEPWSMAENDAA
jgi:glutathione S-transferase